jgi:muramoyltetrapeptide carboxypeptidase
MITPPYLQPGDTIGLVAPASYVTAEEISDFIKLAESWGLKVKEGKNLFHRKNSFAGTDAQRITDFQQMLDDRNIRAIICARGGYGTIRIINKLDFSIFQKYPKWIVGCSDITVLHTFLQKNINTESMHAIMPRHFSKRKKDQSSVDSLRKALFGELKGYDVKPQADNRIGKASGILTGGNLSVLYSLRGTSLDIDTKGRILFIEDVNEYLYHIDRMMMNFKISGKLKDLAGLIVGGMSGMKVSVSGFDKSVNEIIIETVNDYKYPVMFDFPAGHIRPNMALILGREVTMQVESDRCSLQF